MYTFDQYIRRWPLAPVLVAIGLLVAAAPTAGQDSTNKPLVIPRTETPIRVDGRIEPGEWQNAKRLPLVQRKTNFGAAPDLKTEILITHTAEAVYVACRCYDPQPPTITSLERDGGGPSSDGLTVILDTFNDKENGLLFRTTPTGNRGDATISNDASGGFSQWYDKSWNTYWDAEVRRTEEGWFAEMRIPASSLRFESVGGRVVMGLTTWRYNVRKNEDYVFPAISRDQGWTSIFKPSNARDVVFEALESEPPLRVTPYAVGGIGQRSELNGDQTAYRRLTEQTYDAGLDVKYGLTSNFTMDLTVNTDFAQVEADNQQVNLTRFPLFFPEKRRFFLERASTFAFGFGGPNRLFYSRRIGLQEGRQVRILGGARVVGRQGPWDIGALSMQTARAPELGPSGRALPSENFGVLRLQREVINDYSQVGGIVTSRTGTDGSYNLAYGLDGTIRPWGDEYVTAKWAQTFTGERPEHLLSLRPARTQLLWERRSFDGLSYDLRYDRAGRRYQPGVGFERRENYWRLGDRIGYGWLPEEPSPVENHQLNLRGQAFVRNADGSLQSLELGPTWSTELNAGHAFSASLFRRAEDLRAPFALTRSIDISPGRYAVTAGELSYGSPNHYTLQIDAGLSGGGYFDGRRITAQISPVLNPSPYLQVEGFYQINRAAFPARNRAFTAHLSRLRVSVTPSVQHSVLGFIQHNSARELVIANVRYRYNPRQGHDFYLVYNERLHTDRATPIGQPRRPRSAQRAILLKYNHTFNW